MVNTKLENHISFYDKYKLWDNMLDIIYEDKFLLIINKSAGVTIHPVSSEYEKTLSNAVMSYLISENKDLYKNENIHIITRLDKDTSGICIFAKNSYIQELFTNRKDFIDFKKEYITVVDGIVKKDHDIVEKNISRKPDTIILRQVSDLGDFAKTEYFVEKRNFEKNYTILKVFIYTGRTHQIRVHLSSIGHPILGDELYANEYNVKNINKYIDRQALHCYKVSFNHPITGKKISIKADIPYDINQLIQ